MNGPNKLLPASPPRRRWPLAVALCALAAVLGTAGWAGYRMLDPVQESVLGNAMCLEAGNPEDPPGLMTTPSIGVKPGRWLEVRSLDMLDPVNLRLAGTGVQNQGAGIGIDRYPLADDGTLEARAWSTRAELPARLGDGENESLIMAVEPMDTHQDSSLRALRVGYRNEWGIPYSLDFGPRIAVRTDCSVDPD